MRSHSASAAIELIIEAWTMARTAAPVRAQISSRCSMDLSSLLSLSISQRTRWRSATWHGPTLGAQASRRRSWHRGLYPRGTFEAQAARICFSHGCGTRCRSRTTWASSRCRSSPALTVGAQPELPLVPVLPPLVVEGSGAPLLLPPVVDGSGAPLLPLVGSTVVSPEPAVPLPVSLPLPVEVGGGPWDTAPGEQSHSPNPAPCASQVMRPSRSAHGHGWVSPGTQLHGGTSGGSPEVLFMSSPDEPMQPPHPTEARPQRPRAIAHRRAAFEDAIAPSLPERARSCGTSRVRAWRAPMVGPHARHSADTTGRNP